MGQRATLVDVGSVRNIVPVPPVEHPIRLGVIGLGNLDYFIQRVWEDRSLYGSDMPVANPAYRLGQIVGTRVPDGTLRKILGENLARLLGVAFPGRA